MSGPDRTTTETEAGIPRYTVTSRSPRASRFAVIVFALNEGNRLVGQIGRMRDVLQSADLLIADGGSTDGSIDRARQIDADAIRAVLVNRGPRGLGVQMRMAFDFVRREGYAGVVVIDGNGKDDVRSIPAFVDALERGYDHVQGSRFIPGGQAINTPTSRLLGLRLVHRPIIRMAARYPYTDTTNGFRAYSSRFLMDPRVDVFRHVFVGYELHYYLAIKAARLGFRVIELPVTRAYPPGRAPTKIRGLRGNSRVLLALLRAATGAYEPR